MLQQGQPFLWPIQPMKLLRFFLGYPGFLWPFGAAAFYALAALTWRYLQPGADQLSNFSQLKAAWILPMFARNLVMLTIVAGALHLILYWRRVQGSRFKYNSRWPSTSSKAFLFNDQVQGQRVLESRQRRHRLDAVRGPHVVGLRQRLGALHHATE